MSESIWWPDESWWERKVLPLGFITLSFRQLATMTIAFLAAFLVSLPFEFPIAGASFGGRAAVFCVVFGVGYVVSSRRVKLLPVELQAFYFLRTQGMKKLRKKPATDWSDVRSPRTALRPRANGPPRRKRSRWTTSRTPFLWSSLTESRGFRARPGPCSSSTTSQREDLVSPQKPRYRLIYVPLQKTWGRTVSRSGWMGRLNRSFQSISCSREERRRSASRSPG